MSKLRGRRTMSADTVNYGMGHLRPYLAPWLVWLALPCLAGVLRELADNGLGAAVAVGVVVAVAAIVLVGFTAHVFRARGQSLQLHATAYAGLCAVWLVLAVAAGLFVTPDVHVSARYFYRAPAWLADAFGWTWAVWLLSMLVSAISWNIRRVARGDGTDDHAGDDGGFLAKVRLAARPRAASVIEADGARVRLPVRTLEGTADDVAKAAGEIAARAGVRREGVRVESDPNNHANADIVVTPRDQLRDTRPWPGPRAPGESIALPVRFSIAEDGEPGQLWLPGDPKVGRNAVHWKWAGMTGAGKTEAALTFYGEVVTRRDVSVVWLDYVKGMQSCADLAGGMALVLTDKKAAYAAYRRLSDVIRARTDYLGRHGHKQWTPAAHAKLGIKLLVVHIEEAADLLAGSQLIAALSEQARSAGVLLMLSAQRWTHDRIPTSARANFAGGLTFGLESDDEAGFTMAEETLTAGAAPWIWKNEQPGYHYAEVPGVPRKRWAIPHRAELSDPEQLREVVRRWCPVEQTGLDHVTAVAFGKVYADYRQDVIAGRAVWQTAPVARQYAAGGVPRPRPRPAETTAPAAAGAATEGEELPMDERGELVDGFDTADGVDQVDDAPAPADGEAVLTFGDVDDLDDDEEDDPDGEEDGDDVDGEFDRREQPEPGFMDEINPEIPLTDEDDDGLAFGPPAPAPAAAIGPTEARDRLKAMLRQLADDGHETVRPAQLVDFRKSLPRSPGWLTEELQRLERDGFLRAHPDRGVYGLPAKVPA